MSRLLLLFALASAIPLSGCDAGSTTHNAPSNTPLAFLDAGDKSELVLYDEAGEVVATGEVHFERAPRPDEATSGTYRLDARVGYADSGEFAAGYFVAEGGCADRLVIQFDPRVGDAGFELETVCEVSDYEGEWYERNIQGRQARGTFVLN